LEFTIGSLVNGGKMTGTRVTKVMSRITDLLKDNRTRKQEAKRTAVHILVAARVLFHATPATEPAIAITTTTTPVLSSNFSFLPREVQEMILMQVGSDAILSEREKTGILRYALSYKENLGLSKNRFLQACMLNITCWAAIG